MLPAYRQKPEMGKHSVKSVFLVGELGDADAARRQDKARPLLDMQELQP